MNTSSDSFGKYGNYTSQSNGWENSQDIPSYMTKTPPSSLSATNKSNGNNGVGNSNGSTPGNDHSHQSRIKQIKRRRPALAPASRKHKKSFMLSGQQDGLPTIVIAVFLWYFLGVFSIATTKLLLLRGVPPLYLTLQQLFLGSNLLRFLLHMRAFGSSAGLLPWPKPVATKSPVRRVQQNNVDSFWNFYLRDLILAGVYFSVGFAATNISFRGASAAFVETVKAAEPITSAATAVMWGIEVLGIPEVLSLAMIVLGVLLSTFGNASGNSSTAGDSSEKSSFADSLQSCGTIMLANICFSFRGLHQKLFRAVYPKASFDDLNLQFRMQQVGICLLIGPVLIWDGRTLLRSLWLYPQEEQPFLFVLKLFGLALVNGLSFTSYNLASTFVLTRISVVHHAALNCIRRIFAIIVTSLLFRIPITVIGALGIIISFGGFLSFTHYKIKRQSQPKPISTLLPISTSTQS